MKVALAGRLKEADAKQDGVARAAFREGYAHGRAGRPLATDALAASHVTPEESPPVPAAREKLMAHPPDSALVPPAFHRAHDPDVTAAPANTGPVSLPFVRDPLGLARAPASLGRAGDISGETRADQPLTSDATLPFENAALDLIKLDRYVELAVQLRKNPQNAEEIMTRYGLPDAESRSKIHGLWQIRFQANEDLRTRFEALVAQKTRG